MDDRSKYLPLAATAAVCSLAALYWNKKKSDVLSPNELKVDLLRIEQTLAGGGGGDNAMSTLTWFQGDTTQATVLLRQRAEALLQVNPWLAGRVRKHQGKHALVYTKSPAAGEYFHVIPNVVSRDVPLSELGSKLAGYLLKTGATEALWKVAIYPCSQNPTTQFAVVVSLSHVIGDGATFYKVQNMLFGSGQMESLILARNFDTEKQQIQAMGGAAEYGIFSSGGFLANVIGGALQAAVQKTKYTASSRIYLVDPEGMAKAKQAAVEDQKDSKFLSSNDVLTSWFFQNCNCTHGLMALNFRGRLEGHTNQHAGNYENVIFYRQQDSAAPALIRKSFTGKVYQRQVTSDAPMPGFWEMAWGASNAICTNWASFALPCQLEGCKEEIQIPLYNFSALLPSTMAVGFVFRAGPQGLAVMVAGSPDKLEGLEKEVAFLKQEQVVS